MQTKTQSPEINRQCREWASVGIGIGGVIVDQCLKMWALQQSSPWGGGFFSLTLNKGIAFSIPMPWWILIPLLGGGIGVVAAGMRHEWKRAGYRGAPYVLILGGAMSNIIDRLRIGAVIDYIAVASIRINFNFADVMIVSGMLLLLLRREGHTEYASDSC